MSGLSGTLAPIRVSPGGAYFETTDSEPFLFIGPNDAITWPGLAGVYRRKDLDGARTYLQTLAENGVTVLRVMLEYAHREHRYFEAPYAGRFNPAMVKMWDDLFALCETYGLRILLAPWDNFWMSRRWKRHPYNQINGGPLRECGDFFTTEAAFNATLARFRFVIERWGGSGVLCAWDLFNEIHPFWGGSVGEQSAFIARLSNTIRDIEIKTWGWTRPQTVSIFGPNPNEYAPLIWAHPCLDFASTHIYEEGAIDHPHDPVNPALAMQKWVSFARREIARENENKMRPYLDSEHGPIHLFNDHRRTLPEVRDDWYERHLMWAHLASGGAGSGMRWPARSTPHLLTPGMKAALRSLRGFSRFAEWRTFAPRVNETEGKVTGVQIQTEGNTNENVHLFACRDENQTIAWILQRNGRDGWAENKREVQPCILVVPDAEPGSRWRVVVWDTLRGVVLHEMKAAAKHEGGVSVLLEAGLWRGREDMAVLLRRG